ncbi:hypothetical protein [Lacticaseibacillus absianus]|uniref:hypothetical protein n=1 Tax=Lacticaseibacillus absianus TaxID=2729623 RepID=UPI0015C8220B|nr:hypothetical protein [Lacticaseibacillus absianus]
MCKHLPPHTLTRLIFLIVSCSTVAISLSACHNKPTQDTLSVRWADKRGYLWKVSGHASTDTVYWQIPGESIQSVDTRKNTFSISDIPRFHKDYKIKISTHDTMVPAKTMTVRGVELLHGGYLEFGPHYSLWRNSGALDTDLSSAMNISDGGDNDSHQMPHLTKGINTYTDRGLTLKVVVQDDIAGVILSVKRVNVTGDIGLRLHDTATAAICAAGNFTPAIVTPHLADLIESALANVHHLQWYNIPTGGGRITALAEDDDLTIAFYSGSVRTAQPAETNAGSADRKAIRFIEGHWVGTAGEMWIGHDAQIKAKFVGEDTYSTGYIPLEAPAQTAATDDVEADFTGLWSMRFSILGHPSATPQGPSNLFYKKTPGSKTGFIVFDGVGNANFKKDFNMHRQEDWDPKNPIPSD